MSLVVPSPSFGRPAPHRWSGEEFDRASAAGIFDGLRLELIEGQLLEMPPMNEPHANAVQLATYALLQAFPPDRFTVRVQLPMVLGESRPLPDFVILNGPPRQNLRNPTTAMLIIEISDTTLDFDQTEKASLYAENGIPEYWIVNLSAGSLEVRRNPEGRAARYAQTIIHSRNAQLTCLGAPDVKVNVSDLLG